jgi:hypothetical protein
MMSARSALFIIKNIGEVAHLVKGEGVDGGLDTETVVYIVVYIKARKEPEIIEACRSNVLWLCSAL